MSEKLQKIKRRGLLIFILILLVILVNKNLGLVRENLELRFENVRHEERMKGCKEFSLFKQAVWKIDSWKYDLETYNCVDFSKDLVKELEEIGIKSNIAVSEDRSHAWVLVFVEATTGSFIDPKSELEILEIRDGNFEVICSYK